MSFANTKTPTKPTRKAKWQVPMRPGKHNAKEFYLEGELKDRFCKLFPKHSNQRMMQWFGISFSTLQRFKRCLGLEKDMTAIRKELARDVKKICEKNGYYESLRGKAPSDAALEATRRKRATGWTPLGQLKKDNPRRYKRLMKQRSEARLQLEARERRRRNWGLEPLTNLHRPFVKFTRSQLCHRHNALKRGYILGCMDEGSGERWVIFYNDETRRSPIFEQNCIKDGFRFEPE